ncbi:hypothetical protein POM88_049773 [Heracleum sosnowskyi]|uniref:Uncharacterized protein n=1 Tax=Heracleum sosnowskyi TaxID=360622 RepID=A0AAD8GYR4_9APIA|nr:hypothetical protein POM88_049773 [Heracleum sosnowskyi]
MDSSGLVCEKFVKFITRNDTSKNEMVLTVQRLSTLTLFTICKHVILEELLWEPPTTFIERCGSTFPIWPRIALNNGKVFRGTYSRQTGKISCLRTMCDVLGLADLKPFHMLLFTYDGVGMVNVSVFDENLFEVVFPGSPTSIDETSQAFDIASGFEITIQPCHMLKYCYGVDISTEYKDLCNMWCNIPKFCNI